MVNLRLCCLISLTKLMNISQSWLSIHTLFAFLFRSFLPILFFSDPLNRGSHFVRGFHYRSFETAWFEINRCSKVILEQRYFCGYKCILQLYDEENIANDVIYLFDSYLLLHSFMGDSCVKTDLKMAAVHDYSAGTKF